MLSLGRTARSRATKLALGAGIIGSLAFAAPALANAPIGMGCMTGATAEDNGKILGHGATFARNLHHQSLITGYQADVCGAKPDANHPSAMVLYNEQGAPGAPAWPLNTIGTAGVGAGLQTGSGAGTAGIRCRVAAFQGTDSPYTTAELTALRTFPVPAGFCTTRFNTNPNFVPVYEPVKPAGGYPAATDTQATSPNPAGAANGPMSFPIGGAAIAVGVNLTAAACPGLTAPPVLQLTNRMVSRLFGGTITQWNDIDLRTDGLNPQLATCTVAVTRAVRFDNSGTTTQFKNYLKKADPVALPGTLNANICGTTTPGYNNGWAGTTLSANTTWPVGPAPEAACPGIITAPGGNNVVAQTNLNLGAVGYADLENWLQDPNPNVGLAQLQVEVGAPATPTFATAAAGTPPNEGSNCSFANINLPGTGTEINAVGLNPNVNQTWASNPPLPNPNRSDVTFEGGAYPACAPTWAYVNPGLSNAGAIPNASAISRLSHNQRRTLYTYFLYALSAQGQERLSTRGYSGLSGARLNTIRRGFARHF